MGQRTRILTPLLLLACANSGAWASKKHFNIHDDLLAFPQFQVLFPDDYVLESQARELLQSQGSSSTFDGPRNPEQNQAQVFLRDSKNDAEWTGPQKHDGSVLTYEEMLLDGQRYLCQIPQVDSDGDRKNGTGEFNETDEKNELARATDRGMELLSDMEGKCMYYISGWWSYSFCYKKQIKQFHALPSGGGIPNYPPMEDHTTHSFILGRFPRSDEDDDVEGATEHKKTTTDIAELQTKGGSRYLVQRLEGGTKCDLTGRPRKIEVQFHCHPQSTDRIGWIKELTTCSYLMVIYTPRLCNDVAFLPPQQDEVHSIECREIISQDDVLEWEERRDYHLAQQLVESVIVSEHPIVGGIEVGAKKLVGTEGKVIEKGKVASIGEEKVDVIAKRENGEIQRLTKEELKKFDLDVEKVEALKNQIEEIAKGRDWTLEVVESNGERGLRGIIDTDDDEDDEKEQKVKEDSSSAGHDEEGPAEEEIWKKWTDEIEENEATVDRQEQDEQPLPDDTEDGSEEIFFKDEL